MITYFNTPTWPKPDPLHGIYFNTWPNIEEPYPLGTALVLSLNCFILYCLAELTKIYFHKNSHTVVDKTSHIIYFFSSGGVDRAVQPDDQPPCQLRPQRSPSWSCPSWQGRRSTTDSFFHHYDGGFVLESLIFISQANASSWRARLTRNQNTSDQVFPTTKDHCNANKPVMMLVNLLGYVKHAPVVKFS